MHSSRSRTAHFSSRHVSALSQRPPFHREHPSPRPLHRYPLHQHAPFTETPFTDTLHRDTLDRDPAWTETPWTQTSLGRNPLDRDPPEKDIGLGSQTGGDIIQRETPSLWTEWQTPVKTLPCLKLRLRVVISKISMMFLHYVLEIFCHWSAVSNTLSA